MRSAALLVVLLAGCAYPGFAFAPDAGPVVDTAIVDGGATESSVVDSSVADAVVDSAPIDTSTCTCAPSETCTAGVCRPFASCKALHAAAPALGSGRYVIDPDGAGSVPSFAAYCEMSEDGGGWTLALKLDGTKKTFVYEATIWTDASTLNPTSTSLDTVEAKLASFSTMPFTNLRLGMAQAGVRRFIVIDAAGTSLRAAVSGKAIDTTAGRAEWSKLLADPRLQGE